MDKLAYRIYRVLDRGEGLSGRRAHFAFWLRRLGCRLGHHDGGRRSGPCFYCEGEKLK